MLENNTVAAVPSEVRPVPRLRGMVGTPPGLFGDSTNGRGRATRKKDSALDAPPPFWQQLSGLTPDAEALLTPAQRAIALRKVVAKADEFARLEFRLAETERMVPLTETRLDAAQPVPPTPHALAEKGDGLVPLAETRPYAAQPVPSASPALAENCLSQCHQHQFSVVRRHFTWDPMRAVCVQLGISYNKLSAISKEATGLAAHEIADCIRAEELKERMRLKLRGFVLEQWGFGGIQDFNSDHTEAAFRRRSSGKRGTILRFCADPQAVAERRDPYSLGLPGKENLRWRLWQMLKSSRRAPDFDRATYAIEFGFANWARMRRACLLVYNKTPQQLEMDMLAEIADYYDVANDLHMRCAMLSDPGLTDDLKPQIPYCDKWSKAKFFRREWLARMAGEFGIVLNDDEPDEPVMSDE